ncbi:MAG: hypothetical protein JWO32_1437 [Bacteroidetes bacterium]|nr:hypothetical protein [Bacteroidota bacterium]
MEPGPEKEKKVFSDPKLNYKRDTIKKKGFFEDLLEWLAEKIFGRAGYNNISMARTLIIWAIVLLSVLIIIRLLSKSELSGLIKTRTKGTTFNFTDITEDLHEINFDEKIKQLVLMADYRGAIRWHYLKMLFVFDKKGIISFAPHKTNIDYSYELKGKQTYNDFKKLSRIYDYVWYGQFNLTEETYIKNAEIFKTVENQINV